MLSVRSSTVAGMTGHDVDLAPAESAGGGAPSRVPMVIVRGNKGRLHVSEDGVKTVCGWLVPAQATRTIPTVDWHKHTNCYNCTYRLWPNHGPTGYLRPTSSKDFPIRKACPHRLDPRQCTRCETARPQNWPCPNGCTDPTAHDPLHRYTRCTVLPPRRPAGPSGRCVDGCESTERAVRRANPELHFDLADSASMACYHCGGSVCVACQSTPVDGSLMICDACDVDDS